MARESRSLFMALRNSVFPETELHEVTSSSEVGDQSPLVKRLDVELRSNRTTALHCIDSFTICVDGQQHYEGNCTAPKASQKQTDIHSPCPGFVHFHRLISYSELDKTDVIHPDTFV